MNRSFFLISALCIGTIFSCTKEAQGPSKDNSPTEIILEAFPVDDNVDTKTIRQSSGATWWENGDQISLFFGDGNNGGSCFTTARGGETASFSGTLNAFTAGGEGYAGETTYFWGVYPYKSTTTCDNNSVTLNIPSVQPGRANSFASGVNISVGRSENLKMGFYNVCTGYSFSVSVSGITELMFKSKDETPIVGDAKIEFVAGKPVVTELTNASSEVHIFPENGEFEVGQKYYLEFIPVTLEGFTVTLYNDDGQEATYETSTIRTFERGKFTLMSNIDTNQRLGDWTIRKGNIAFMDPNFKTYCVSRFDTNGDGEISFSEASVVKSITCWNMSISNIDEIKYFKELIDLTCSANNLTSLDLSKNTALQSLSCDQNEITSLDLSNNVELRKIQCDYNPLTTLDLSNNKVLGSLTISGCQISAIDLTNNTELYELSVSGNPIADIDLSHNVNLLELYVCGNVNLSNLDLSNNTALTSLTCTEARFATLDLSKNVLLERFDCGWGNFTSLDLSNNTALTNFNCTDNKLTSLDVSKNTALRDFACARNQLTSLDVSKNVALTRLYCSPMNDDSGQNLLQTLYIYNGQQIDGVTVNRSSNYVPDGTMITDSNPGTGEGTDEDEFEEDSEPNFNGHEYVDLGLPSGTLWATMNLGSSYEYEVGTIYPIWVDGYSTCVSKGADDYIYKYTKYVNSYYDFGTPDDKRILDLSDDRANVAWGGSWHMPTAAQIAELKSECTFRTTTVEGQRVIIAEKNGKSVVFPLSYDGEKYKAEYWSNQLTELGGYFVSSSKDDAPLYYDELVSSMNFVYVSGAGMNIDYGSSSYRSAESKWSKMGSYHFVRPVCN